MATSSVKQQTSAPCLYEVDFHSWAKRQARAIREGRVAELDWDNLAEEIESLGRNDKRALESHLEVLIAHLLKCVIQPERRTRSWDITIDAQRGDIARLVDRNPSLRGSLRDHFDGRAFQYALRLVARDTGLGPDMLPTTCLFTLEQVLDPEFFPAKRPHQ